MCDKVGTGMWLVCDEAGKITYAGLRNTGL